MIPPLNPIPSHPNKLQPHGAPGSVSQQGMQSNQFQGKPFGFNQNTAPFQAQAGMMMNQQMRMPFNNFVPNLGNGSPAMSTIVNASDNPYIAMHNALSMLGMPNFIAQGQMPFGPQGSNPIPFVPIPLKQNQPTTNQLLPNPPVNMPLFYNQNSCFPNQNMCFTSPMQNKNQFMPNFGQGVPMTCNMPPYPYQNFQPLGIQMPIVQPNGSMPQGNQSQSPFVPPQVNANSAKNTPSLTQPSQGNSSLPPATNSVMPSKAQQHFGSPGFSNSQMNEKKDFENTHPNANWRSSPNRHSGKNIRQDAFQRLPNGKFQNGKRKFNQHGWHDKKEAGHKNDTCNNIQTKTAWRTNTANQTNAPQTREQDISQWIEERKKNYPSKANIEKKQTETDPAVEDSKARLRCQQLKEVLARQAELGVEVAEIPAHYLLEGEVKSSYQRKHGREEGEIEENEKAPKKGKRFKTKSIKRGRRNKNKKLKVDDGCSANEHPPLKKTLLQKLLGEDIRREKIHLLQVFRFMTMNSFFKEWPEKPLLFPSVTVAETEVSGVVVAERKPGKTESENVESSSNYGGVIKGGGNGAGNVHEEGEIID